MEKRREGQGVGTMSRGPGRLRRGIVRTLVPLLQLLLVKVCGLLQFGQLLLRELGLSVLRVSSVSLAMVIRG